MNTLIHRSALLIVLSTLWASPSAVADDLVPCWAKFSRLIQRAVDRVVVKEADRVRICGYQDGVCYENANLVVKALTDKGVALEKVRVLYVSHLAHYNVHAVVVHNGKVFDALRFRDHGGVVDVRGVPVHEYFATTNAGPGAMVLDIDSRQYLSARPESMGDQFGAELFGREPTHRLNRRLSLQEYLRRSTSGR